MTWLTSPKVWQWYHGIWAVVWVILYYPAMVVWNQSLSFLMFVSIQTALTGALAGYAGALAGRKADPEDDL